MMTPASLFVDKQRTIAFIHVTATSWSELLSRPLYIYTTNSNTRHEVTEEEGKRFLKELAEFHDHYYGK